MKIQIVNSQQSIVKTKVLQQLVVNEIMTMTMTIANIVNSNSISISSNRRRRRNSTTSKKQ